MTTNQARRDALQLSILYARAHAFEAWHNEQVETIIARRIAQRSDDDEPIVVPAPPETIFEQYRCLDLGLRELNPPAHEDRKYLAEVRCWLQDGMDDLCAFDLEHAIDLFTLSVDRLDWLLRGRSRAGSRRYRILDEESKTRIEGALASATALLAEVVKVRQLESA